LFFVNSDFLNRNLISINLKYSNSRNAELFLNIYQYKDVYIYNYFLIFCKSYFIYSSSSHYSCRSSHSKDYEKRDQGGDAHINVANFLRAAAICSSIGLRINDVPHVRWSPDHSRSAIDGLDLGQDDAESARRTLLRGHGFSAAGRQDGRDCRSEIEVVPLAVNLWNAATGRSIIRFELRPSNCARVIRADRLLLPFRYILSGAANYSRLAARLW